MEALERHIVSQDWVTITFLLIIFLLVIVNIFNPGRLKSLISLPYNNKYLHLYSPKVLSNFNLTLFVVSNLVLGLFFYILFKESGFILINKHLSLFLILFILSIYWIIKYFIGFLIAYIFDIKKIQKKGLHIKMTYFFSSNLYLMILLIFSFYFFNHNKAYLYFMLGFYIILLIIRYAKYIQVYKKYLLSHFFYIILYLCVLEIAPILIALKAGLKL